MLGSVAGKELRREQRKGDGARFLDSPVDATETLKAKYPVGSNVMESRERFEVIIVGGGIAGASLVPKTIRCKWAGLRTFAPDRVLVVGEDPLVKGFFWLAGQGGCGIETSPAVGQIAADLLVKGRTERYDATALAPTRFVMR